MDQDDERDVPDGSARREDLDGVETAAFADAAAFEEWLGRHHDRREGVWIRMARKGSGIPSVTSDELVDIGLCYGWISGQRRSLDATHYLQKYVPRRPRSLWSQVNVAKVAALTAAGRMREPGLAEVRRAQADGRWDAAYASQKTAEVPADLAEALAADPAAAAAFEALDRSGRYRLALPLLQALTPQTRQARLDKALQRLRSGGPHN
ncbi:YdeI/OmpD-associated family protein [Streptomyces bambusae]|uniref:YdeI/OmpD-associated family protein n=1 Tax=Streptomyces bambusae TaxID=1550616 RepID=UPI001CFE202B|nr:YdeI/OmpD-associated family protein [Streptomyces bambusae]MCB5167767.1 YdeI/OmpD-associated family protein [Streptomyces bambusae]